ncbi:MAG: replication-associated recombination protein A [Alphaproteobacteria bacterium]|nr:replication-associated recombination protein A [Alphaproteobacteria bacterium]
MNSLFEHQAPRPLADKLRPTTINEVVGQDHLLSDDGALGRMINSGSLSSFVLWGPPGCGKTTIARLLAQHTNMHFEPVSAVFCGVADLRKIFAEAKRKRNMGQGTLLFVDEIHRFDKRQQDAFLPYVEDGTITLVGATTENPSFELNAALMSRCQVFALNRLDIDSLDTLLSKTEASEGKHLPLTEEARDAIKRMADGDGRFLYNLIDTVYNAAQNEDEDHLFSTEELASIIHKRAPVFDKAGDGHFNLMSALHKSLRGSDTDAALYWISRMLEAGEDPKYILRRLTRFAFEDVGMADPNALQQAIATWNAFERIGSPEGDLAIAQLVIYLGTAPKSVSGYKAFKAAKIAAGQTGSLMPPKHILNAPTKMMGELGYGEGYQYDPDTEDGFSGQDYFPEEMGRSYFYQPPNVGFEREINKRLAYWEKLRKEKKG